VYSPKILLPIFNRVKWQIKLSLNERGLYEFKDYQDSDLVRTIVEKGFLHKDFLLSYRELSNAELRSASVLGLIQKKNPMHVLDFGGGTGNLLPVSKIIFPERTFKWVVVETQELCNQVSKHVYDVDLYFKTSTSEARLLFTEGIDVAILGSSLQYTKEPLATLEEIIALKPSHIWINKTPVTDSEKPIRTFQRSRMNDNGPGREQGTISNKEVEYPITICPIRTLEDLLEIDYEIIFKVDEGPFLLNGRNFVLKGYFCKIKQ
jgi:putative methyltransferase (TIGR04325 family)